MSHYTIETCPSNTTSYTDDPLTGVTEMRKTHIDELRAALQTEFTRRQMGTISWSETIVADSTELRKTHLDELRSALYTIKTGAGWQASPAWPPHSCPSNTDGYCTTNTVGYCTTDSINVASFTNNPIIADITEINLADIEEIRDNLNEFSVQCVCENEVCQYCGNCGHAYLYCSHGCYCEGGKYSGCTYCSNAWAYSCSINNTYTYGQTFPYSSYPVPWNCMCAFTPGGTDWGSCEYQGAHNHEDWGCKCTPYTWP